MFDLSQAGDGLVPFSERLTSRSERSPLTQQHDSGVGAVETQIEKRRRVGWSVCYRYETATSRFHLVRLTASR